jgi:5-methylcytosine-specific restriction endonuclease McrA
MEIITRYNLVTAYLQNQTEENWKALRTAIVEEKKCAYCNEPMYTTIRAHHHTENGQDVTA